MGTRFFGGGSAAPGGAVGVSDFFQQLPDATRITGGVVLGPRAPHRNPNVTYAMNTGQLIFSLWPLAATTITEIAMDITATSAGASEVIEAVIYNTEGGLPTTLVHSESLAADVATEVTASVSVDIETGIYLVGALNPSGNSGTVTVRAHNTCYQTVCDPGVTDRGGLNIRGQATASADMSSVDVATSGSSSTTLGAWANIPSVFLKA